MRAYVGVTDNNWAAFLAAQQATECNFWRPSAPASFRALHPGEPFLFKTHYPDNRLVGGGFFEHYTVLRASEAWDFMGVGNGVATFEELVERRNSYHRDKAPEPDPRIGCTILNDVRFFPPELALPGPPTFAPNVVAGKGYTDISQDSIVEQAITLLLASTGAEATMHPRDDAVNWRQASVRQRLGQGGFQAVVLDAYRAQCAITGHKIRPTLQAAHIRPVTHDGPHSVNNGLLLRSDVHTMFDRGYLSLTDDLTLLVSPRLRSEFGNGEEFYARSGRQITAPDRSSDCPSPDFLEWHRDVVFLAG